MSMNVSRDFTDVVATRHASTVMDLIVVSAGGVTKPLEVLVTVSRIRRKFTFKVILFDDRPVLQVVYLAICGLLVGFFCFLFSHQTWREMCHNNI